MAEEFAWVIEHADSDVSHPLYWVGPYWSSDHNEAKRFETKDAAKDAAEKLPPLELNPDHRICEHGWLDVRELGAP